MDGWDDLLDEVTKVAAIVVCTTAFLWLITMVLAAGIE